MDYEYCRSSDYLPSLLLVVVSAPGACSKGVLADDGVRVVFVTNDGRWLTPVLLVILGLVKDGEYDCCMRCWVDERKLLLIMVLATFDESEGAAGARTVSKN